MSTTTPERNVNITSRNEGQYYKACLYYEIGWRDVRPPRDGVDRDRAKRLREDARQVIRAARRLTIRVKA